MPAESCDLLVVGGGPAGLCAAELGSAAGLRTVLADRMRSVGRKFLVAGRGGLNLTHSEPFEDFILRYGDPAPRWRELLTEFSPQHLRQWCEELGVETFVGTSRRVFPVSKQAAPLLRRWIERLRAQGVSFRAHHRLTGFRRVEGSGWEVTFDREGERVNLETQTLVLALGGASWPQTGSDGTWMELLGRNAVPLSPLAPANCGYEVDWPAGFLASAEGQPLKNIAASAGSISVLGELLITSYGLEGGALYQLSPILRAMSPPEIVLDLKPTSRLEQLIAKLESSRSFEEASRALRLGPVAIELLRRVPFTDAAALAKMAKALPIPLRGPRPMAEAISTAGGVKWDGLDHHLMLKGFPGIFCAGEMIDWEAPTGGYLLQGCFATGTRAGLGAIRFVRGG